jgi:hypothetical protein
MVNGKEVVDRDVQMNPSTEFTSVNDAATMADWSDICRWEDEGGAIGRSAADGD